MATTAKKFIRGKISLAHQNLPCGGQVMVVVFGHEIGQINRSHRGFQTRVQCFGEQVVVIELSQLANEFLPFLLKIEEQNADFRGIVVGLMRGAIGQIGSLKFQGAVLQVFDAANPKRFEVGKMADFFFDAPSVGSFDFEQGVICIGEHFTESGGRSAEAFEYGRQQAVVFYFLEFSVKPFCPFHAEELKKFKDSPVRQTAPCPTKNQ